MRSPLLAVAVLSAMCSVAHAAAIDPLNERQASVNPYAVSELPLQQALPAIDVPAGQSAFGMFNNYTDSRASLDIVPTLLSEATAASATQTFGIWFGTDSGNLLHVDLLLGAATAGAIAALSISEGQLSIGAGNGVCGATIACGTVSDARISRGAFGFYFDTLPGATPYVHTIDALNQGPVRNRVLAYDAGASNWVFAYEDSDDFDYQDMVVQVSQISAVPEPGAIGLALAGGLILAGRRRRGAGAQRRAPILAAV